MPHEPPNASISFFGGAGAVTGANFLLRGRQTSLLVDCGLIQGERFAERQNREPFPYAPASVPFLLVTHAHTDHIGRVGKLVRDGFRGKIISTPETKELAALMLDDALSILRDECGAGEEPIYDEADVGRALSLWKAIPYHQPIVLGGEFEAVLKDAGHVLGSAMFDVSRADARGHEGAQIAADKRRIVFTGDLGNSPSPILRDTEVVADATFLVMESVYGDRNHEGAAGRKERLAEVLRAVKNRGGALLIPCFSLEKTQVLLHEMNDLLMEKKIPALPVFLDSPLAIKITQVYRAHSAQFNDEARREMEGGDDIFKFPRLTLTANIHASQKVAASPNPKIIIAGSGMSAGGRIVSHERHYLSDPRSTVLFVGFQAVGSLGRRIQEGVKRVAIGEEEVAVRAHIETITGYSSHKGRDDLTAFVEKSAATVEKVFVTMGEPRASMFLAQRLRDYLGVNAVVPQAGESVEISL